MNENIDLFFALLNSINQSAILLQIGIVLVSLIVASLVSRHLGRKILGIGTQQPSQPGLKKLTFSTVRRILFPLTALLLVLVSLGILLVLGQPVKLLNIAISLLYHSPAYDW